MATDKIDNSTVRGPASSRSDRRHVDVYRAIVLLANRLNAQTTFYRESFRSVARHFKSPYSALSVRIKAQTVEDSWHSHGTNPDFWNDTVQDLLTECLTDGRPVARFYNSKNAELRIALLACPLKDSSWQENGAIAMATVCEDVGRVHACLAELKAMASLISACADQLQSANKTGGPAGVHEQASALARAASYSSKYDLAFTITNKLRNKIGCDQVSLGVVKGRRVQLLSVSGFDDVAPRSPGVSNIRAAMEECLDRNLPTVFQKDDDWADERITSGHRLHKQWSLAVGGVSVATIPLQIKGKCVCTLSLRRNAQKPFKREELDNIRSVVEPWAPGIKLIDRADRNIISYGNDLFRDTVQAVVNPKEWTRKAMLLVGLVVASWFCFGSLDYQITVPCTVAPLSVQHVVAPYDGTIKAAYVTAADQVSQGQSLYELDASDAQLERDRLLSSIAVSKIEVDQAVAAKSVAEALMARARVHVYEAQLTSVERRIEQSVSRTLYDGTVTVGDLRKSIGQTISQGEKVFEIARNDGWLVELEIPNDMAIHASAGQVGHFASHTRPEDMQRCQIVRVRPTAEERNGKTVFVAEAQFDNPAAWLRAGMEGVTKINVGGRPVWWVVLHRLINSVRMIFWV